MKFRYIKSILSAASLLLSQRDSCIGDLDASSYRPDIVMTFDQASVFLTRYMEPSD